MKLRRTVRNSAALKLNPSYNEPAGQKGSKQFSRKFSWKRLIRPTIYVVILAIFLYAITASSLLRVNDIEVEGAVTISSEDVRRQVENVISSSPISQNVIFVPLGEISDKLKTDNYQIATVKIDRVFPTGLKVTISEQKPNILWKSAGQVYIISEDGRAYGGEVTEELERELPLVVDSTNLPVRTGERQASAGFVKFVRALKDQFSSTGLSSIELQVGETTTDLSVTTTDGYQVKFDTTREIETQIGALNDVLSILKKQGKKPAEYIDLRINGRAFYK